MKKMTVIAMVVLAAFVMVQGLAIAEMVSGKISAVNSETKSIKVNRINATTGTAENVDIWVSEATQYAGAASLAELQAGDEVSIDASQDATTGNWMAASVETKKAE